MIVQAITKKDDEYYTPAGAIKPLVKYLKPKSRIWCPFDVDESNFVKVFKENEFEVINSHIDYGQDFFKHEVPQVDYIISNPPYSLKYEVLKRLFELNIPFAMLLGVVGLFESKNRFNLFKSNQFEILYFDKRVKFLKSYQDLKPLVNAPFSSVYICSKILPKQICFEELDEKKKEN